MANELHNADMVRGATSMKMYMIASIFQGNQRVGFRILDSDTGKIIDVTDIQIMSVLKSGQKIINLEISEGKLQGSNGGINRYAKLNDGKLMAGDKGPVVILNQLGETGYTISDHNGKIIKAKTDDIIKYANSNGIANGKISTRNNAEFISAISGTYERIDIPLKQQAPRIPEKKQEIKPVIQTNTVESAKLSFTPEQLGVLKDYYTWVNIDPDTANREIESLNNTVSQHKQTEEYNKIPLIYEILTTLGSSFNIGKAFGNEIGSKLIMFISTELPFPKSLLEKCAEYATKNISEFYSILFSDMTNTVEIILKAENDTMSVAARLYIEHLVSKGILGEYSEDSETDLYNKKYIKTYAFCEKYTFNELRALIGSIDLIGKLASKVESGLDRNIIYRHKKELFYICNLYYKDDTKEVGSITRTEKLALLEAIGYYRDYYDKSSWEYLINLGYKVDAQDKVLDKSNHREYQQCLFISTVMNRLNGIESETNIEELYEKQLKIIEISYDLVVGKFNQFVRQFYFDIEAREREERNRLRQEEAKRLEEQRELDRQKEIERQKKITEEIKKESTETNADKQLNKLQQDILNGNDLSSYDRVDLYKELKSRSKGPFTDICFVISDDMISRRLRYSDMSKKQKFRFDEAISKLTAEVVGTGEKTESQKKVATQGHKPDIQDNTVNNTYMLEDHPEIKTNVEELLSKADSVEMSAVLKEEPVVLKICYSVLKFKKASDKQLKHINKAIELLHNQ